MTFLMSKQTAMISKPPSKPCSPLAHSAESQSKRTSYGPKSDWHESYVKPVKLQTSRLSSTHLNSVAYKA